MTPKEAFKIGFMQKCAVDGLTPDETLRRIRTAKFAYKVTELAKEAGIGGALLEGGKGIGALGAALALLAPPAVGIAGGYSLANATTPEMDNDEAKKREELAEYQRALESMKQVHQKQLHAGRPV